MLFSSSGVNSKDGKSNNTLLLYLPTNPKIFQNLLIQQLFVETEKAWII